MNVWPQMAADKMTAIEEKIQEKLTPLPPVDIGYYRSTSYISFANMLGAGVLVYFTWGYVDTVVASIWLAVHWFYSVWQMRSISQYLNHAQQPIVLDLRLWKFFAGSSAVNSIIWAVGVTVLYTPNSIMHQLLLFAVLIVMILGYGAVTMILCPVLFLSFAVPVMLPLLFYTLSSGDGLHYTLAGILVVSVILCLQIGLRMHRAIMETRKQKQYSLALAKDLAAQKCVAEEANRAKSIFLAAASHDLRQPVHAMGLFVEDIRNRTEGLFNATVSGMESSVDTMRGLLGSLLDISKLEAGAVKPEISDFPIQRLIDSIEQNISPVAAGKGIHLCMRSSRAYVRSDPTLLYSILTNLVSNAVKYTRTGKVLVGCRIRNNMVRIEIWDTGPGIPEDEHENIFREFYQLKHNSKGEAHGMGLGLAIVSKLAQLLEHSIQLKSVSGRGSCFSVELPMVKQARISTAFINQPRLTDAEFAGKTILVVDNDCNILASLGHLLNTWGCRVVLATSGAEGLALLKGTGGADIAIAEVNLDNGESGLDVILNIRKQFGASLCGLLIAGEAGHSALKDIQSHDIKLLYKPVPPARLRRILAEASRAPI